MSTCIFCRVARGELPAKVVLAQDDIIAFHDIAPHAPVHVLVIPRRHIESLAAAEANDSGLLGRLMLAAAEVARRLGIAAGFRVVANSGAGAGQTVHHIHLHVLGGRPMSWPPG